MLAAAGAQLNFYVFLESKTTVRLSLAFVPEAAGFTAAIVAGVMWWFGQRRQRTNRRVWMHQRLNGVLGVDVVHFCFFFSGFRVNIAGISQ